MISRMMVMKKKNKHGKTESYGNILSMYWLTRETMVRVPFQNQACR